MYQHEIKNYKWIVSEELRITKSNVQTLTLEEQETILLKPRLNEDFWVDCYDQTVITKLSKSVYFTLKEIFVSDHPLKQGLVLAVKGTLNYKGLTFNKNRILRNKTQTEAIPQN